MQAEEPLRVVDKEVLFFITHCFPPYAFLRQMDPGLLIQHPQLASQV